MREIKASQIIDKVKELFLKANYHIGPDLLKLLQKTLEEETSPYREICLKEDY
jgi:fumarate hydratase subunit alpha